MQFNRKIVSKFRFKQFVFFSYQHNKVLTLTQQTILISFLIHFICNYLRWLFPWQFINALNC